MPRSKMYRFYVLTPVYEDAEALYTLVQKLLEIYGNNFILVAIDDGSIAKPLTADRLSRCGVKGKILRLKINVGHQKAIAIGINYISNEMESINKIIIMDSDGEDRPESIELLLNQLEEEAIDVAIAIRSKRTSTYLFKIFYWVYKRVFIILTGKKINFGNFMALKLHSLKRLALMPELIDNLPAAVILSRMRLKPVIIERGARYAGESKMNFQALVLHGLRGIMVFSDQVLIRVGIGSLLIGIFAFLLIIITIFCKVNGLALPGWSSLIIGTLMILLVNSLIIGLIVLLLAGNTKNKKSLDNSYINQIMIDEDI